MDEITALKGAILTALRGNSDLTAICVGGINDVPPGSPNEPVSPYIRFGPFSSSDDAPECFETYDIIGQIDVYSWGTGEAASTAQANKISGMVRNIIDEMKGNVEALEGGYTLSDIAFRSKRSLTASDGKTKHTPITISAIVDKN